MELQPTVKLRYSSSFKSVLSSDGKDFGRSRKTLAYQSCNRIVDLFSEAHTARLLSSLAPAITVSVCVCLCAPTEPSPPKAWSRQPEQPPDSCIYKLCYIWCRLLCEKKKRKEKKYVGYIRTILILKLSFPFDLKKEKKTCSSCWRS